MVKTPEEAHEDLAYVREAIEYQRRFIGEHLPPWLAALTALYLLVAVGSRYYLDDALGDTVSWISTLALLFLFATGTYIRSRKKPEQPAPQRISSRAMRKLILPIGGMLLALLVLVAARNELGLIGDEFRIVGLLIVGLTMLSIGLSGTVTATAFGLGMLFGALAIVYGQYMLLGALLAGSILIGSWVDRKRARALDA